MGPTETPRRRRAATGRLQKVGVVINLLAVALLTQPLALPQQVSPAQAPWLGRWILDPAQSTRGSAPSPYKRVMLRIDPWQDGLKVVYDMVGVRGGVIHMEWTGRLDGKDYAVQGVDYVMTNAYRPEGENGYSILVKVDGRPVASARGTASADRKMLTSVTSEKDAAGKDIQTTSVYVRR